MCRGYATLGEGRYDSASPEARRLGESTHSRKEGEVDVVNAYILIQTEVGKAAQVAKEVSGIKGVAAAEDVTGPYDVIVRAEAHGRGVNCRDVLNPGQSPQGRS